MHTLRVFSSTVIWVLLYPITFPYPINFFISSYFYKSHYISELLPIFKQESFNQNGRKYIFSRFLKMKQKHLEVIRWWTALSVGCNVEFNPQPT